MPKPSDHDREASQDDRIRRRHRRREHDSFERGAAQRPCPYHATHPQRREHHARREQVAPPHHSHDLHRERAIGKNAHQHREERIDRCEVSRLPAGRNPARRDRDEQDHHAERHRIVACQRAPHRRHERRRDQEAPRQQAPHHLRRKARRSVRQHRPGLPVHKARRGIRHPDVLGHHPPDVRRAWHRPRRHERQAEEQPDEMRPR